MTASKEDSPVIACTRGAREAAACCDNVCCSDQFVHDPGIISGIVVLSPCCHVLETRLLVQQDSRSVGRVDLEDGNPSLRPTAIQPCVGSWWHVFLRKGMRTATSHLALSSPLSSCLPSPFRWC